MTKFAGRTLGHLQATVGRLRQILAVRNPLATGASTDRDRLAVALGATGAWFFQIDAQRLIRDVYPVDESVKAALLGRDIRSFIDPLDPLNEHPRMVRAFRAREPFRDLLMAGDFGRGRRLLRVSGAPVYDSTGEFAGYCGISVDATGGSPHPDANIEMLAPDLRQALTNTLGVVAGFAQFLTQDLAAGSTAAAYADRIRVAIETARNIVTAPSDTSAQPEHSLSALPPEPSRGAHSVRLLLVNENPELLDLLSIAFDRAGFECAPCSSTAEAIEIVNEAPAFWDVLVTSVFGSAPGGVALMHHARERKPGLLCVVCDAPLEAALAETEADLCWPRPAECTTLAHLIRVQLGG